MRSMRSAQHQSGTQTTRQPASQEGVALGSCPPTFGECFLSPINLRCYVLLVCE